MAKDNKEKLNKKPNLERFAPQSVDSAMQTFAESEIPEAPKKKKNGWLSNGAQYVRRRSKPLQTFPVFCMENS